MSLNKYMHPRNPYKTPPNFKQLALDYPDFRQHVKQDVTGKVSVDFKDVRALRALTCTLLKKDFGLDVEMPLDKMIPTVPLRLNYILWIEDLLSVSNRPDEAPVRGLDIGTGAACIYSLLAATKGWTMVATDIDRDSLSYAQENVRKNKFEQLIRVKCVDKATILKEALSEHGTSPTFDFCMCNPPFFASMHETKPANKARRPDQRPLPRNAFTATHNEVVSEGGEVAFLKQMIAESRELSTHIRIYTTMIGHKSSLPRLKIALREAGVLSFKQTEFYQGKTTRWALAWTYDDIDLRAVPEQTVQAARKAKLNKPLELSLDKYDTVEATAGKIRAIFDDLEFNTQKLMENKSTVSWRICAFSDTWSNQRRKRREQKRATEGESLANTQVDLTSELVAQMQVHSPKSPGKREREEETDSGYYANCKRVRLDDDAAQYYLKASVSVRKREEDVILEFGYLDGKAGKEGLHQVMQYMKNNLIKS